MKKEKRLIYARIDDMGRRCTIRIGGLWRKPTVNAGSRRNPTATDSNSNTSSPTRKSAFTGGCHDRYSRDDRNDSHD
jgi:hypothetical protein